MDGVHANAIAQQGTTGLALGRVHTDQANALIRKVHQKTTHQFIDHRRFARSASSRNTQNRHCSHIGLGGFERGGKSIGVIFRGGNATRNAPVTGVIQLLQFFGNIRNGMHRFKVGSLNQIVDHALQSHRTAIIRMVNALDTIGMQFRDLFGQDGAAAAAKNADVAGSFFFQQVLHVLEVLHVSSLVGGHGNGLGIFLNRTIDHFIDTAVMPQVNDFTARPLHDAPHDVDGGIVPVKEARCGDDSDLVLGVIRRGLFHRRLNHCIDGEREIRCESECKGRKSRMDALAAYLCAMEESQPSGKRINKYLSEIGYCSRRAADKLIELGQVTINGVVPEMGTRLQPGDVVAVKGEEVGKLEGAAPVYIALHKPVGIVCTTDQVREKDNIIDFIDYPTRIFPIGRLDKMSEGLIFLTNDGDIVNKILRARHQHEKEYHVMVNREFDDAFLEKMSAGVQILDTITLPCAIERTSATTFRMILTQGLNRQIRRMCEALGHRVIRLQRSRIMNVDLDMPMGEWRHLTEEELTEIHLRISKVGEGQEPDWVESEEPNVENESDQPS